jgi:small conductance mechanosensitive channel
MLSELADSTAGTPVANLLHEITILLPRLGMGLVVFLGFWIASGVVRKLILRIAHRMDFNTAFVLRLAARAASIALLVFGAVTALGTMGINVSALVAGLGLTGFALGFAMKDVLSNLVAGILILLYRPFRLNDYIAVTGLEGRVIEIDLRYTTLLKGDHTYLIPNSVLFTNSIVLITMAPREEKQDRVA